MNARLAARLKQLLYCIFTATYEASCVLCNVAFTSGKGIDNRLPPGFTTPEMKTPLDGCDFGLQATVKML